MVNPEPGRRAYLRDFVGFLGFAATRRARLAACVLLLACRQTPAPGASATGASSGLASASIPLGGASAASSPAGSLAPLASVEWLERLELPDQHVAFVTPPVGATEPRPLMIAVHGAGDRPEWACGGWRLASSSYAFVACPQGSKVDPERFAWDSARSIEQRVRATVSAVRERFGAYVADGPTLYLGFSQGATLARSVLLSDAQAFQVVVLAEGGYDLMRDVGFLRKLRAHGTSRVAVVCGGPACFRSFRQAERDFSYARLEVSAVGDAQAGHNLNQRMQTALQTAWPSLVRDLPNWTGFQGFQTRAVTAASK